KGVRCRAGGECRKAGASPHADPRLRVGGQVRTGRRGARPGRPADEALERYFFFGAAAGFAAAALPFLPLAGAGAATATFASCRARRPLRRAAFLGWRMP